MGTWELERGVILGTAGHIDHGKTALVRALTGVDTDRLPEEKRRGITIDLGFAPLEIDGAGTIGIIDVPGHEAFVRTMLAGASGIDLALLVIAADEGVMPQTREHLDILSLLGIPRAVIAVTKSDLVDEEWRSLVREDVRALLSTTSFADSEIVDVSSHTGMGLNELRSAIARASRNAATNAREDDLFRMPVDRAFTIKGTGTVVTGTVWSGMLKRDGAVRIEPGGKAVRVRGIQAHGAGVDFARPGTRAALALAGCELDDVGRGSTIVADREFLPTSEIDVVLTFTDPAFEPSSRSRLRVHIGTAETDGRLSRMRSVGANRIRARLILEEAVVARGGDRFVVRIPTPARTVGGGEIIDPYPPRRRMGAAQDAGTAALADASVEARIADLLESAGPGGIALGQLPVRTGLTPRDAIATVERAGAVRIGDRLWAASVAASLQNFVESFVALEMANHPLEDGVSLQTIRAASKAPQAVMDYALDRLVESGSIEIQGAIARPGGWISRLGERDQVLSDSILHEICIHAVEPPSVSELIAKFGENALALLRRLEREGRIERVAEDRYFARDTVLKMVGTLRTRLEPGRNYSPAELREVLGVSRKYLIPFLEFCDRKGITERGEAGRSVRAF